MYLFLILFGPTIGGLNIGAIIFPFVGLIILIHEYGHILTARYFGIRTDTVVLSMLGGVAYIRDSPKEGWHEVVIALAGPLTNLVQAIIGYTILQYIGFFEMTDLEKAFSTHPLAAVYFGLNMIVLIFNLIPAFPLDGGRVLRGILRHITEYTRATKIAATIGILFGIFFFFVWQIYSIGGFTLPIIGIFLIYINYLSIKRGGEDRATKIIENIIAEIDQEIRLTEKDLNKMLSDNSTSVDQVLLEELLEELFHKLFKLLKRKELLETELKEYQ